ncbi:hypothetical protein A676_01326 [Salmonella enterica subsp. enterica serovar Enteritidis str. 2010K-0262]|uniref:Uncharacterized protein n=2 Tax=Salmonella enterica I TaxID=59201 RepID=M7S091_SALDU|nr:hypothetical protein A670_03326 [Salmonella enterica subsp. enterica serovar Dublin str. UC16]EPI70296.1 hypothetical protein A671_02344 [Salmonella enterica subsp. enterica serovar Dublin str. DG22]EPI73471.1 hypothetical protein A672_01821 [Salmonella enterica subsp. enterica serovar Enteritidis str. 08-1080]EPI73846.1 hypothetical protein A673_01311 [Salmonella enterica subsp. enterica serovar Enteritidis str. 2009K0958]EPI87277.1 hypothetical protein A674_02016 [Salmonella enterica subsp
MINGFAVIRKAGSAIRHQPFSLSGAYGLTKVSFTGLTELTLAAFRRIQWNNMIAGFQAGDPLADLDYHAAAFVTQDCREYAFRIIAGKGKSIGMANAGMSDFDQNFAFFRRRNVNLDNF